jgi:hypothetical protein
MHMRPFLQTAVIILSIGLVAGCASTPVARNGAPITIFQQPIERVQKAAVDALIENGFEVKKQEPTYVEGTRPYKLFGGGGGETVGIWLVAQAPGTTEAKADNAKALYGYFLQWDWCAKVMETMSDLLVK